MTRAEKFALKAIPRVAGPFDIMSSSDKRKIFIQGYEQAEKDTIERAIAWLNENADRYIVDLTPTHPDAPVKFIVGGMCWEDLRKAMEDEK